MAKIRNLWKNKFDPDADYVWTRSYPGVDTGSHVVKEEFHPRRIEQLYNARKIVMADVWAEHVGATPAPKGLPETGAAPHKDGKPDTLDYGKKGGSLPADERDELEPLREQLAELGVNVDRRWGEKRLNEELEKATAPVNKLPGM